MQKKVNFGGWNKPAHILRRIFDQNMESRKSLKACQLWRRKK